MTEEDRKHLICLRLAASVQPVPGMEDLSYLVGSQKEVEIPEEWKDRIWKCPSCKFWFPIDWNHDDEVCCACAGCTVHPFLHKMVDCQCPRCTLKTRYGKTSESLV